MFVFVGESESCCSGPVGESDSVVNNDGKSDDTGNSERSEGIIVDEVGSNVAGPKGVNDVRVGLGCVIGFTLGEGTLGEGTVGLEGVIPVLGTFDVDIKGILVFPTTLGAFDGTILTFVGESTVAGAILTPDIGLCVADGVVTVGVVTVGVVTVGVVADGVVADGVVADGVVAEGVECCGFRVIDGDNELITGCFEIGTVFGDTDLVTNGA